MSSHTRQPPGRSEACSKAEKESATLKASNMAHRAF